MLSKTKRWIALIVLIAVVPTFAARFNGVEVTWLGHAGFKLVSPRGTVVLIDPWLDNPKAPKNVDLSKVDLILVTHGHFDHIGNTVEIAKRTGATVVAIFEVSEYLKSQGVKNAVGMNKGGTFEFKGIKVRMVEASHSSGISGKNGMITGGEAAGYVVEFENGYKVYHTGDTGLMSFFDIIGDFYKPDLLLVPIGDHFTMGPKEAAYAVEQIKPKWVIPMHYGTFPILKGTPSQLKNYLKKEYKGKVIVAKPGELLK